MSLQKVFDLQKFTDVTFQLDDGQIKAHKCILATSNISYFEKLFLGLEWKESLDNVVIIKECSLAEFTLVIQSAYGCILYDKTKPFNIQLLYDLIAMGDRFGSNLCIDAGILMCSENNKIESHYKDILDIFMKYSPLYDDRLKTINCHRFTSERMTWKLKYKIYIAKLADNHTRTQIMRHLLENYNLNDVQSITEAIRELLQYIDPFDLTKHELLLLVKHRLYPGEEVCKIFVWKKAAHVLQKYPLVIVKINYIGTFKNGQFKPYDKETRLLSNLMLRDILYFEFQNDLAKVKLSYGNEYALYKENELVNFNITIYDKIYKNPDGNTFSIKPDIEYKVLVYLKW